MPCHDQGMAGHAAPRRKIFHRAGIGGDQLEQRTRRDAGQVSAQLHDQLAAPKVAGVPTTVYPVVSVVHGRPPFLHLRRLPDSPVSLCARYAKSAAWS